MHKLGLKVARSCERDDEKNEPDRSRHGREPNDPRLAAECVSGGCEKWDERRLIDVTECRMAAAHDKVQFVTKEIVAIRGR